MLARNNEHPGAAPESAPLRVTMDSTSGALHNHDDAGIGRLVEENFDELRRIAHARLFRSGHHTLLQTADLVNEVYLRLAAVSGFAPVDRIQFLAYAARTIRSIIVDHVRERSALRRGGDAVHVTFQTGLAVQPLNEKRILDLDEALAELRHLDAPLAQLVEMRFFGGVTEEEIARALGVSDRTVRRQWEKARRVLAAVLSDD
jgi:RNA polymerase sigma factor (TIGR02999 family)